MGKNTIPEDHIGLNMDADGDEPGPPATESSPWTIQACSQRKTTTISR